MSNIDENFCKNCGKTPVYVREHCRKCYYKLTQNGTLSIKIHKKSPDFLTEYQQNILTGTLLGDAHLKKITENENSMLEITRSDKDKGYIFWQYEAFKDFCNKEPRQTLKRDKKTNIEYLGYHLDTRRSPIFTNYRKLWYPNGKKIIPQKLVLNPLIIAIWLCDDGCIVRQSKNNLGLRVKFSTNGFELEDIKFLTLLLEQRYGTTFKINKNGNGFVIVGYNKSAIKIIEDIRLYIPPCMQRKLKHYFAVSAQHLNPT